MKAAKGDKAIHRRNDNTWYKVHFVAGNMRIQYGRTYRSGSHSSNTTDPANAEDRIPRSVQVP